LFLLLIVHLIPLEMQQVEDRETVQQDESVLAKSERQYSADNIGLVFNHGDVLFGPKSY